MTDPTRVPKTRRKKGSGLLEVVTNLATIAVALCLVGVTGLTMRDRIRGPATAKPTPVEPVTIAEWEQYGSAGIRIGTETAPVTMVVFSDYQCPFCAEIDPVLWELKEQYGDTLALVFRSFPLVRIHPLAAEAAIAAECGNSLGKFRQMHRVLFQHQDSLDATDWPTLATRAGITELPQFQECLTSKEPLDRVNADLAAAKQLGIPGTPSIMINDKLLPPGVAEEVIAAIVASEARANVR